MEETSGRDSVSTFASFFFLKIGTMSQLESS